MFFIPKNIAVLDSNLLKKILHCFSPSFLKVSENDPFRITPKPIAKGYLHSHLINKRF